MSPAGQRQRTTTVAAALAAATRHDIVDLIADQTGTVVLCGCGEWFTTAAAYNSHRTGAITAELTAPTKRRPAIDRDLLGQVAEAYRGAGPRGRHAAVAAVLGVPARSAGTYVHRARRAGLL
mgnify:CR=1 FL=1